MEVKVGKVELSVTNNGTPKVNIYPEGSDFENIAESIEIIGEESIYAMTRKAGDVINIIEKELSSNTITSQHFRKKSKQ